LNENKTCGIFVRVGEKFNDYFENMIKESTVPIELKTKGYSIDKSVIARFGILYICKNFEVLQKNPEILIAASKCKSSEDLLLSLQPEKPWMESV